MVPDILYRFDLISTVIFGVLKVILAAVMIVLAITAIKYLNKRM